VLCNFGHKGLGGRGFLASEIGTLLDQRSDQTQQLYMLRPIASLTKECANFNVGHFSARGHIGDVSDKNEP